MLICNHEEPPLSFIIRSLFPLNIVPHTLESFLRCLNTYGSVELPLPTFYLPNFFQFQLCCDFLNSSPVYMAAFLYLSWVVYPCPCLLGTSFLSVKLSQEVCVYPCWPSAMLAQLSACLNRWPSAYGKLPLEIKQL